MFYAIWIKAKFLRALNKTLKFDLQEDDHDMTVRSNRRPNFFKKALSAKQIRFLLMEWAYFVAEKKWRNSVSRRNSSRRFLHGPPLSTFQMTYFILQYLRMCQIIKTEQILSGLDELPEVHFEFLNRQIDNGFFNRPIIAHTQILVHRWGPRRIRIPALFHRQTYITRV